MKLRLIENWAKHLVHAWSVRIAYLATLPGICWPLVPSDVRDHFPPELVTAFAVMAGVSIIFARIVEQPKMKGDGQ